jgi:dolichyl-phosphate beta-glucosyltransferase
MLSVVIPAYNEARRLPATITALRSYLDGAGEEAEEHEVIVVDDGSTDGTSEGALEIATSWSPLRVLSSHQNHGKGWAVRSGMLAARGELRLFTDADLSTPIQELPRLRARIGGRTQVVIASRAMGESHIVAHQPRHRELMGRGYNRLLQWMVLPGLHDTQCGFKLFTAEAAVACFEPLRTMGFGFDAEVLLRARRLGWQVAEVGVVWRHVENSRVSPLRDSVSTFADMIRLRLQRD